MLHAPGLMMRSMQNLVLLAVIGIGCGGEQAEDEYITPAGIDEAGLAEEKSDSVNGVGLDIKGRLSCGLRVDGGTRPGRFNGYTVEATAGQRPDLAVRTSAAGRVLVYGPRTSGGWGRLLASQWSRKDASGFSARVRWTAQAAGTYLVAVGTYAPRTLDYSVDLAFEGQTCWHVALHWYTSCGTPVCFETQPPPAGVPVCTADQMLGTSCGTEGQRCLPPGGLDCGRTLVCMQAQPTLCPRSSARYKQGINYLDAAEKARFYSELLGIKLATYKYNFGPMDQPDRLGFIIEDTRSEVALDPSKTQVDVYGYASMAVAALQVQAQQIDDLKTEVKRLQQQVSRATRPRARP